MNYDFKIYFTTEAELDNFIKSNGGIPCGECIVGPRCFNKIQIGSVGFGIKINNRCDKFDKWIGKTAENQR
jgi:hypothetical protein